MKKENAHSPSLFDKMNCVKTVKICQTFDKKEKKRKKKEHEAARQNTNDMKRSLDVPGLVS